MGTAQDLLNTSRNTMGDDEIVTLFSERYPNLNILNAINNEVSIDRIAQHIDDKEQANVSQVQQSEAPQPEAPKTELDSAISTFGEENVATVKALGFSDEDIINSYRKRISEDNMQIIINKFGAENVANAKAVGATDEDLINAYKRTLESGFVNAVKESNPTVFSSIESAFNKVQGNEDMNLDGVLRLINIESRFDPNAKSQYASGLGQFIPGTWNAMVNKYGEEYDIGRDDILDPEKNAIMTILFNRDNAEILKRNNIEPTLNNIYIMHFAGEGAGIDVLSADDSLPVSQFFSNKAVEGNASLLVGKTVGEFKQEVQRRLGTPVSSDQTNEQQPQPQVQAQEPEWATAARESISQAPLFPNENESTLVSDFAKRIGRNFIGSFETVLFDLPGVNKIWEESLERGQEGFNELYDEKYNFYQNAPLEQIFQEKMSGVSEEAMARYIEQLNELKENPEMEKEFRDALSSIYAVDTNAATESINNRKQIVEDRFRVSEAIYPLEDRIQSYERRAGYLASEDPNWAQRQWGNMSLSTEMQSDIGMLEQHGNTEEAERLLDIKEEIDERITREEDTEGLLKSVGSSAIGVAAFMLPYAATAAIPGTGPLAAFNLSATQGTGEIFEKMRNSGISVEEGSTRAQLGGLAYAAIEKLSFDRLKGLISGKAFRNASSVFVKFADNILRESNEEGLQEIIMQFAADLDGISNAGEVVDLAKTYANTFVQTIPTMAVVGGAGSVAGIATNKALGIQPETDGEAPVQPREQNLGEPLTVEDRQEILEDVVIKRIEQANQILGNIEEEEVTEIAGQEAIAEPIQEVVEEPVQEEISPEAITEPVSPVEPVSEPIVPVEVETEQEDVFAEPSEVLEPVEEPVTKQEDIFEEAEIEEEPVQVTEVVHPEQMDPNSIFIDTNEGQEEIAMTPEERAAQEAVPELTEDRRTELEKRIDKTMENVPKYATRMVRGIGDLLGVASDDIVIFTRSNAREALELLGLDKATELYTKISNPNQSGFKVTHNGKTGIYLSPSLKKAGPVQTIAGIAHEFSHVVAERTINEASPEATIALDKAFDEYIYNLSKMTVNEYVSQNPILGKSRVGSQQYADDYTMGDFRDEHPEAFGQIVKKNEWFADNGANWMLTNKKPSSIIEKVFFNFAQKMTSLIKQVNGNENFVDATVAEYFNTLERAQAERISSELSQSTKEESQTKGEETKENKQERKVPLASLQKKEINKERKEEGKLTKEESAKPKERTRTREDDLAEVEKLNDIESLSELAGETEFIEVEEAADKKIDILSEEKDLAKIEKATTEDSLIKIMKSTRSDKAFDVAQDKLIEIKEEDDLLEEISVSEDITRLEEIADESENRKINNAVEARLNALGATKGLEGTEAKAQAEEEARIASIEARERIESGDDPLIDGMIERIEDRVEELGLDPANQRPQEVGKWNKRNAVDIARWMENTLNIPKEAVQSLSKDRLLAFKKALAPYYGIPGMDFAGLFGTGFKTLAKRTIGTTELTPTSQVKVDLIDKLLAGEEAMKEDYEFRGLKSWLRNGLVIEDEQGRLFYGPKPKEGVRSLSDIQGDLLAGESGRMTHIDAIGNVSEYDNDLFIEDLYVVDGEKVPGFIVDQKAIDNSDNFLAGLNEAIRLTSDVTGISNIQQLKDKSGGENNIASPFVREVQLALNNLSFSTITSASQAKQYVNALTKLEKGIIEVFPETKVESTVLDHARAKLDKMVKGNQISETNANIIHKMLDSISVINSFDGGLYKNSPLKNFSDAMLYAENLEDFMQAVAEFAYTANLDGLDRSNLAQRFIKKYGNSTGFGDSGAGSLRDFFINEFNNYLSNATASRVVPAGIKAKAKRAWLKIWNGLKGVTSINPVARQAVNKAVLGTTVLDRARFNTRLLRDPKKHGRKYSYNKDLRQSVEEAVANTLLKRDLANIKSLSVNDAQAAMIDGAVRWVDTAGLQRYMFRTIKNIKKVNDRNWNKAIEVLESAQERFEKAQTLSSIEHLWHTKLNPATITDKAQKQLNELDQKYDLHKMQEKTETFLKDLDMRILEGEAVTPSEARLFNEAVARLDKIPLANLEIGELLDIERQLEEIIGEDIRKRKEIKELGRLKTKIIHDTADAAVGMIVTEKDLNTSLTDVDASNIARSHLDARVDQVKALGLDVLNSEYMLDMLGDGGQAIKGITLQPLWDGGKELDEIIEFGSNELWQYFEDNKVAMEGFSDAQFSGLAGIYHNLKDVKKQSFNLESGQVMTLTPSELVNFFRLTRDEDGYRHLTEGGFQRFIKRKMVISYKITEKDITNIWEQSDIYGDLAVGLDEFVEQNGRRLDEVSIERTGHAMTDGNPMHNPLRVAHRQHFESSDYESINDFLESYYGMRTAPYSRTKGAAEPLVIEGVDIALSRMIHDNAVYIAYGERANDAKHGAEVTASTMRENGLAPVGDKLERDIDDELNKRFDETPTGRFLSTWKGIRTVGILSHRFSSAGLQAFSGPLYLAVADNFAEVAAHIPIAAAKVQAQLVAAKGNPEIAYSEMFEKNSTVRSRWDNGFLIDTILGRYAGTAHRMVANHNKEGAVKWLLDHATIENGMWMIKIGDMNGIAQAWELAKADVKASQLYEIGSDEYWDAVVEKHDIAIRKTQPTNSGLDKMGLQKTKGLKQLISFASYRAKAFQITVEALHNLTAGNKKKGAQQLIAIATVTALASLFKGSLKALKGDFDDDEDEFDSEQMKEYLASNFIHSFPEMLPFWGGLYTRLRTERYGGDLWLIELMENIIKYQRYSQKANEAVFTDEKEKYEEKAREVAVDLAVYVGIGAKGILDNLKILEGTREKIEGDPDGR